MAYIYQNFFIKAPIAILEQPLPLTEFIKKDGEGNDIAGEYYTIPEYLATFNHTVERYNEDNSYFIKGFAFNVNGLDEMRARLTDFGLTLDTNVWILSPGEIGEELAKPEWQTTEV